MRGINPFAREIIAGNPSLRKPVSPETLDGHTVTRPSVGDATLRQRTTSKSSKPQYIPKLATREEVLPARTADFELGQNHPNPFNPTTTIPFTLYREQQVHLVVYDQLGREIAVLADGVLPAGSHERVFDAAQLPAGVYHYQLTGSSATETRTLTLLK